MAAPTAAPSITLMPGITAPAATPPAAPIAAPCAISPDVWLSVAQALRATELASTTARNDFCIVFLPIVDLPDHAPGSRVPRQTVHVTREETTITQHRSGNATMLRPEN